jgi:site-specific DNA-methyltransferase (adenine-specific)
MSPQPVTRNTMFYGDNLPILQEYIPDESVDLVYLDPPFNSNRSYNVLFREESGIESEAQIEAFDDTWHWNEVAEQTYNELITQASEHVSRMVAAFREFIGANQIMAYLVMMTARLVELHRVLKPSGSIYLHCDTTASHYLKIILDTIFGVKNFRRELIWKRSAAHGGASNFNDIHDVILYFSKNNHPIWNPQYTPHDTSYIKSHYSQFDEEGRPYQLVSAHGAGNGPTRNFGDKVIAPPPGRHWMSQEHINQMMEQNRVVFTKSGMPRYKRYLDDTDGIPLGTVWDDIFPVNSQAAERLGYPTQKPLALLERIIRASSNPGDVVLDPFCGCGTAIAAAQKLHRAWIGIDITHLAIAVQKYRMKAMFPDSHFQVIGEPADLPSAKQLAHDDRYQFQWWALSLIHARPFGGQEDRHDGKKGSDKGVDGVMAFVDSKNGKPKRVIVQVKSGHVNSSHIRDFRGTLEREQAAIGIFLTLEEPTRDMITEAVIAGFYQSEVWNKDYPRIQILTIEEILHGAAVRMPPQLNPFKDIQKEPQIQTKQPPLPAA